MIITGIQVVENNIHTIKNIRICTIILPFISLYQV